MKATSIASSVPMVRTQGDARSKLLGLQVLRFVAALGVFLFHIGSGFQLKWGYASNIFGFGAAGVDIFFIISGFIIAYTTDAAKGAWLFYRRRLVRIIPLYWTLTLGIVAIAMIKPDLLNSTYVSGETLFKSLFFIPFEKTNGTVRPLLFLGWTLNYEMFFYSVYAMCLTVGLRVPLAPAALIVVLVLLGRVIEIDNVAWVFYTSPLMLEFVFGIGLYLLHAHRPSLFAGNGPVVFGIFATSLVVRWLIPDLPWLVANGVPAAILVAAVLPWVPRKTPLVLFLVLLGDASYSLYLTHPYIIQALIKVAPEGAGQIAQALVAFASCLLSIALSILLYRTIERPAQKLLNPWSSRGDSLPVPATIATDNARPRV